MFIAASLAILVTMGLALARALAGPTTYDRIAAVNMFGTKTVLLIAVLAFLSNRSDLLDIALVSGLLATIIYLVGLVIRSRRTVFGIGLDAMAVLALFGATLVFYWLRA